MDKQASNQRKRMELVEGDGPTDTRQNPGEAWEGLSLAERMAAIRAEAFGIGKDDIRMQKGDKSWTIKGHTVEAVLSEMRPLLAKYNVGLIPQLKDRVYNGNRCDVLVDFEFTSLDCGESQVVCWAGSGTDAGDKAFSKAGTNALKEMLKKVFLITDRDDAKEEEEKVEHLTDDQMSRAKVEQARAETQQAIEAWANTFRRAIESCTTLDELKAAERDNKRQLTSDKLPAVTRNWFIEEIEKRKKELSE